MKELSKQNQAATLTVHEAFSLVKGTISRASFYAAINRGEIPHLRLGRRILIPRHAYSAFLRGERIDELSKVIA